MIANIPNWSSLTGLQRACAVLDWCVDNGIHTASIMPYQLAAAMTAWTESILGERRDMGEEYPFEPSSMDYVHQVRATTAFLRSRI